MIIEKIKNIIKRMVYPNKYCSEAFVRHLKSKGAKIGDGTYFYDPIHTVVDETSLPFIEIGRNCRITQDVIVLAHDYSYAVLRPIYHKMLCKAGVTKIGDNVFIGMRAIILMGSTIGNNVIIGAGAVVSGDIPDNVIVAGNPGKVICTLEEYYNKNLEQFEQYAQVTVERKKKYLSRIPNEKELGWYNCLWQGKDSESIYRSMKVDGDETEAVIKDMMKIEPLYGSYEEFLNAKQLK